LLPGLIENVPERERGDLVAGTSLVGRERELDLIVSFIGRAARDGEALLLLGEPGVGKSALLEASAQAALAAGTRILSAAGVEFEADIPFSGLHQILLPLHEELARLRAVHRDTLNVALGFGEGPEPDRLVIANATLNVLREAARAYPLLLIVDDVPWLDRASAGILGFLARRLTGSRVGLLAASRTGEEGFFERAGLPEIEVGPLDKLSAARLMHARFPTLAENVQERLLAEAQGNPLAVLELPAALSGPQRAALDRLPPVLPLTRRLQTLFRSRIVELPERSRRLMLLIALDGAGDVRLLQVTGTADVGPDALTPAERAGLVTLDGRTHRLTFRHPMIGSAVVALATNAERRSAHDLLAKVWADQPDRRVWHLAEASVAPDEHVAALLEQASQRVLRRGDGVGAVNSLMRAADLSPMPCDRARRLALAAYTGASVGGELHRAKALLAGVRTADPDLTGSVEAAVAASYLLMHADGDIDTAHRLLVGAIEHVDGQPPSDQTAEEALRTLSMASYYGGRPELWERFNRVIDRFTGEHILQARFRAELIGDPVRSSPEALSWLDAEIPSLAEELDPSKILRTAGAATNVDRLPACREALQRLTVAEPEGGAVTGYAKMMLSLDGFRTGRWVEARALADEALALATEQGHALLAWNVKAINAFVGAARGEDGPTRTIAEPMLQWAAPRGLDAVEADAAYALTLLALGRGDFEDAFQQAARISPAGQLARYKPHAIHVMFDLVEAAIRSGRRSEAAAHAQAIGESNVHALSPRLALIARGATAVASPDETAFPAFENCVGRRDAKRWPFELARIRLAYGERLRRARSMSSARVQLTAALESFEALGAVPWVARAAGELRATGQVRSRSGDRDALTPQELEIASLAASGMTNKQIGERLFLSHRTVSTHLHRVFPKLGISSRAALRDALSAPARD
jgi:DNA-binding CsgD family transcriptional regulator